jgi:hypothetical protein
MTFQAWLVHNVSLNAEAWRERDKGAWQKRIHDAKRARKEVPWTDKAIWTPRDDYGMKSI